MRPMINVDDVHKKFGERTVLGGVSLSVRAGEMVAVTGPSGCGKSTLLNCVGLLDRPDGGRIVVDGLDVLGAGRRAQRSLLRSTLGYMFQNYALIETATVEHNLKLATTYSTAGRRAARGAIDDALERVGLGGAGGQRVYELSGGEQQRVALARLLLKRPRVILADEPTGALDPSNREVVLEKLAEARDGGAAVLVVTHDAAVVRHCDREVALTR